MAQKSCGKIILPVAEKGFGKTYSKVELSPDAADIVRKYRRLTGLTVQRIVAEIIIQSDNLIEIVDEDE